MFNPAQFLTPPTYALTPAARMQITLLGLNEVPFAQSELQALHMGRMREAVAHFIPQGIAVQGSMHITDGDYHLVVVDAILPDDYQRRTVICVDTEVNTVRVAMFYEAGLLPPQDNNHESN